MAMDSLGTDTERDEYVRVYCQCDDCVDGDAKVAGRYHPDSETVTWVSRTHGQKHTMVVAVVVDNTHDTS